MHRPRLVVPRLKQRPLRLGPFFAASDLCVRLPGGLDCRPRMPHNPVPKGHGALEARPLPASFVSRWAGALRAARGRFSDPRHEPSLPPAGGPGPSPSAHGVDAPDALLLAMARRAGMEAPLAVLAEAHSPFLFLYGQFAYMAAPHLAPYAGRLPEEVGAWLEDPHRFASWLRTLTTPARQSPRPQR